MEKKIALVIGCFIAYLVLYSIFGPTFNVVLMIGLIGYGMYKYS